MKSPARIASVAAAIAFAFGGATLAQANTDATHDKDKARAEQSYNNDGTQKETLGEKTRNAFHRMGNKVRSAMHRHDNGKDADKHLARNDGHNTRAMGANAAADETAHNDAAHNDSRQHRMDDAYANWQHKQKQ